MIIDVDDFIKANALVVDYGLLIDVNIDGHFGTCTPYHIEKRRS